jgi:multidrug transporter EmrE-like cation transporter
LLKVGTDNWARSSNSIQGLFSSGIAFGMALYGSAFILYIVALKFFPVNFIHPILTAAAIVGVNLASALLLGEKMSAIGYLGILLIVLGVFTVALGK